MGNGDNDCEIGSGCDNDSTDSFLHGIISFWFRVFLLFYNIIIYVYLYNVNTYI